MATAPHEYEQEKEGITAARFAALLHEQASEEISRAIGAIEAGDIEARCNALNRACEIIGTLHLSLDELKGGVTAQRMASVYLCLLANLLRVNFTDNSQLAAHLIEILRPLRDAWREISETDAQNTAASGDPAVTHRFATHARAVRSATL